MFDFNLENLVWVEQNPVGCFYFCFCLRRSCYIIKSTFSKLLKFSKIFSNFRKFWIFGSLNIVWIWNLMKFFNVSKYFIFFFSWNFEIIKIFRFWNVFINFWDLINLWKSLKFLSFLNLEIFKILKEVTWNFSNFWTFRDFLNFLTFFQIFVKFFNNYSNSSNYWVSWKCFSGFESLGILEMWNFKIFAKEEKGSMFVIMYRRENNKICSKYCILFILKRICRTMKIVSNFALTNK